MGHMRKLLRTTNSDPGKRLLDEILIPRNNLWIKKLELFGG